MNMIALHADQKMSPQIGEHGKPLIDKITITVPAPNKVYTNSVLMGGTVDHDLTFKNAAFTAINDKALFNPVKQHGYYISVRIALEKSIERPFLQVLPKYSNKNPFMRLEFNPFKLGYEGMAELAACLIYFLDSGSDYVWEHGRVSRLDVACDLYGVEVGQLRFLNKWGTTQATYSTNGKHETIYIGSAKSQQTKVYDKAKQLKLNATSAITRVERKLKPQLWLKELTDLSCPFQHMLVAPLISAKPEAIKPWVWEMFNDAVAQRGPAAALALLPTVTSKIVVAHLKKNSDLVWAPTKTWGHWSEAIKPLFEAFKPV